MAEFSEQELVGPLSWLVGVIALLVSMAVFRFKISAIWLILGAAGLVIYST